jgi:glutathione-regulated potassium-efflux system ancillary protein KefF
MVLVLYAHPYPDRSRANRAMLRAVEGEHGVRVRSLYDLYPDLAIDVAAEHRALEASDTIVLQHPLYWYAPPALVAMWLEKVLVHGWAFGEGAAGLAGKRCLWVVTLGSGDMRFLGDDPDAPAPEVFAAPIRHAMRRCGATWLPPMLIRGVHDLSRAALGEVATAYRERIVGLVAEDAAARSDRG